MPEQPKHVLRAAIGDPDVFAMVYRQMRSLSGNTQDLDDLVQVALEQAYRSIEHFEERSKLSTWVYAICYRVWLKHHRWHRRWFRRFAFASDVACNDDADPELSAAEHLERQERFRRLRAALSRLSPKLRAVVTLHDLEGLGVDEIVGIVRAKPLTVRSRLRDGRRRLGALLRRDAYFGDPTATDPTCGSGGAP